MAQNSTKLVRNMPNVKRMQIGQAVIPLHFPGFAAVIFRGSPMRASNKPTGSIMLRVRELTSRFLRVPSLEVAGGECVAVMGRSGAGKSLLLRAIADLDPNDGDVSLDGRSRADMSACEWRRQVMLVPAESGWWADVVGAHFLAERPADGVITALGLPPGVLDWTVARLSTGERHRLAIARALCFEPRAMLLDEPTASLDAAATERVEAVLRARLADGACLLLVTHDREQAARLATRTMVIADGRLPQASASLA